MSDAGSTGSDERSAGSLGLFSGCESQNPSGYNSQEDEMENMDPYIPPLITDDELYNLKDLLRLSSRRKIVASKALYVLMDLQQASARWLFTVENVMSLLDCFVDDSQVQVKVVVCFFSRLFDLHRLDVVLRFLKADAQQAIIKRLGYLNVINPLKVAFDYVIDLRFLDNRILLVSLMELASAETAGNIMEESNTELSVKVHFSQFLVISSKYFKLLLFPKTITIMSPISSHL